MSVFSKEPFSSSLLEKYENLPRGRFINFVVLRTTQSETIFRTEGSGEPLSQEITIAGSKGSSTITRVILSKRKQTSVERRVGRELLRDQQVYDIKNCLLNTQEPCGECPDCYIYGYAVGSGGAQRSRVITEDAYSLLDIEQITAEKTFNALYDNSTMRHPETKEASSALGSSEYIRPGTHFLDIEVVKDITKQEFIYVLGNILRARRYGAISTRIGLMDNKVLAIGLGRQEIFSSLELTQRTYDLLEAKQHPLPTDTVAETATNAANELIGQVFGWKGAWLTGNQLTPVLTEVEKAYQNPEKLVAELRGIYPNSK